MIVVLKTREERNLFFIFSEDSKCNDFIITVKENSLKTPSIATFISSVNSFLQEILGNSDIKTTMRYIRPKNEDMKKC